MKCKKGLQKLVTITLSVMLVLSALITNVQAVSAAEIHELSLESEMALKKASGEEVYEILDDNGDIMGYYLPGYVSDQSRSGSYNVNWTIPESRYAWGRQSFSFVKGDEINVSISQSPSGAGMVSYLGLYDVDTGSAGFPSATLSTNGWSTGVIVVGHSGHFSLAIKNLSSRTITYTGRYWF